MYLDRFVFRHLGLPGCWLESAGAAGWLVSATTARWRNEGEEQASAGSRIVVPPPDKKRERGRQLIFLREERNAWQGFGIGLGMYVGKIVQLCNYELVRSKKFKVLGCWQGSLDVQDLRVGKVIGKIRRCVGLTRQGCGLDVGKTKAKIKLSVGSMLKYSKCWKQAKIILSVRMLSWQLIHHGGRSGTRLMETSEWWRERSGDGGACRRLFMIECEKEATLASGEENEVGEGAVMAVKRFFSQFWWCGGLGCCFCGGWRRKEK
ncbi:hypothetical protein H5410_028820 [Solanum commersonii]|uniref:Uncharacterized protein n=1 Tax=Solanum commersonii TaxID=4109 RepID=A0A9J5Z5X5_SOLCO|nr:hypothetical protein H5410_028820 [Solanum commersonii]